MGCFQGQFLAVLPGKAEPQRGQKDPSTFKFPTPSLRRLPRETLLPSSPERHSPPLCILKFNIARRLRLLSRKLLKTLLLNQKIGKQNDTRANPLVYVNKYPIKNMKCLHQIICLRYLKLDIFRARHSLGGQGKKNSVSLRPAWSSLEFQNTKG